MHTISRNATQKKTKKQKSHTLARFSHWRPCLTSSLAENNFPAQNKEETTIVCGWPADRKTKAAWFDTHTHRHTEKSTRGHRRLPASVVARGTNSTTAAANGIAALAVGADHVPLATTTATPRRLRCRCYWWRWCKVDREGEGWGWVGLSWWQGKAEGGGGGGGGSPECQSDNWNWLRLTFQLFRVDISNLPPPASNRQIENRKTYEIFHSHFGSTHPKSVSPSS